MALTPCPQELGLTPCGELPGPVPCEGPPEPTPCGGIRVCCSDYLNIETAWKATGIPPHKLRFYAKTPSFQNIYYI